jgi:drug/metabolite transporter (DMT)-like permease
MQGFVCFSRRFLRPIASTPMEIRTPVKHNHYLAVTLAWYISTILAGLVVTAIILSTHSSTTSSLALILEIGGAVLTVLAVISPAAVYLTLKRLGDPAAGMTASATIMLGHVLIISGPFILLTPVVARHLSIQRHNSGGY